MADFGVNVVAGMPSRLYNLFLYLLEQNARIDLDLILFAGEPFFPDQVKVIKKLFPNAKIRSLGYGSVDGGILAFADDDCCPGEHRAFDGHVILEIVDDEGNAIVESGIPGAIVITNLVRKLMPIIRYPTGDRGAWIEEVGKKDRKFRLMGRGNEAARLADVNVYPAEVLAIANKSKLLEFGRVQLVIRRASELDHLTVLLVTDQAIGHTLEAEEILKDRLLAAQPVLQKMTAAKLIAPIDVVIGQSRDLILNPKTGKALNVVDLRHLTIA